MSNEITMPQILIQQTQFCLKINQNNFKLFTHVQYLRSLVTNIHQMYNQLCKKLIQVTDQYQRKIVSSCKTKTPHSEVILQFVKSISFLHFSINSQLSSNSVTLGTKTYRIAKNRVQNLKDRLLHCNEICNQYISEIRLFNKEQKQLVQQCDYFKDYQKDVLKYYSLKKNVQRCEKLQAKEIALKQSLEYIFRRKQDFQAHAHQVRVGLKDCYQLQKNIISEYSRLLLNIRKVNRTNAQVYAQAILELSSQPSQSQNSASYREDMLPIKKTERPIQEKAVSHIRREIIKDQEKIVVLEGYFEQFMNQFNEGLKVAAERIDELRSSNQYQKFTNDKLVISQILPFQSIREIDLIVNEICLFRLILLNLNTIFGKMKVIKEISKYRISNFEKFLQDSQHFIDQQKKNQLSSELKQKFTKYQAKFLDRNTELTSRYRQRVVQLQNSILGEYKRQDIAYQDKSKKKFKNDLFEKAYYEILMLPFFLNRVESVLYQENPYLRKIKMHLSANQVQKSITLAGYSKSFKPRKNCCGGFFMWNNDEQQGSVPIKEYVCALKQNMLIQGCLTLYEHHLRFSSHFNSKTLFGDTDIRIPKWDIYQIILGKHLLSVKITLQTTHGNLDFTNFMTMEDPYEKLMEFYDSRKHVGSIAHKDDQIDSELFLLQQRFQSDFQSQLLKASIIVDTLSTYLSEDKQKLSISIEYHLNGSPWHAMFEIKIIQKMTTTDYYFIHDRQSKNNQAKSLVENISKKLINMKDEELLSNVLARGQQKQLQFSIIQGTEKNKLSFQKQPSFINVKGYESIVGEINMQDIKINHLQLAPLLSSRILAGIQSSRHIELESKMVEEKQVPQPEQSNSSIMREIEFVPMKRNQQCAKKTSSPHEEKTGSVLRSKKTFYGNSSISHHYTINESKKQRISHTKPSSTKSKSIDLRKYQKIFYVIIVLFFLNLILNWIV